MRNYSKFYLVQCGPFLDYIEEKCPELIDEINEKFFQNKNEAMVTISGGDILFSAGDITHEKYEDISDIVKDKFEWSMDGHWEEHIKEAIKEVME